MIIRPATPNDVPAILDIYNEAVLNTTATYDYEPSTLAERITWFDAHISRRYPIYIAADVKDRVVGWSSLSEFRSRVGYRYTAEDSIYVAADWRGQGIGKLLLPPLLGDARTLGLRVIIAVIDADSAASLHLHELFGFERVAYLKQVGYKFSRWLDAVYMELLLERNVPDKERS